MGYLIEIDKDKNLISITYDETSTFQDRVKVLDEVINYLRNSPTMNIFIDASSAKNALSADEQLKLGKLLGENSKYFSKNKTAVFKQNVLHPIVLGKAFLDGHTHLVEFDNKTEALQWLSGKFK